ncbi:rhomboid family intramembrane serine protease [Corynebacterium sp. ES2794-CONJ1]|uniref:rhomboid family intramembrane serine protease n=1 Tax=unclassified Corynebacterium TaxID=2624378 RepID=UPI002169B8C6|nr:MULTISPECIES: rhomboid family intramembrane serine protease [unclassified Corynebacterium]MCS4490651.1 rhomboid family intramembrane serine protease [Corynebacterium sp. ES2775-CONJ]MCS4492453.1 rhomboid family intramembrane serine protease [Corynebacterium sp. ES2715-CONJ3]MCS4532583.1 rhomboid family intramembrane serine protease [Corynebacterium sp. ES2730-CONJ]MCU9519978.1 rhomboid family intramembrane serine protease [Corynebacterium sp. ES2794-CONJ1]
MSNVMRQPAETFGPVRSVKKGLIVAGSFLVLIWSVQIIGLLLFPKNMAYLGIRPLEFSSVASILSAPFVHGSFSHLIANSVPGAIFAFLVGYSGYRVFVEVTMITIFVGGLGVWITGGMGTVHIGASGLVYGWLVYLVARGVFNKSFGQVVVGVVLGLSYSGMIWGIFPTAAWISWQGHLFGALGGFLAAATIVSDDPKPARKPVRINP